MSLTAHANLPAPQKAPDNPQFLNLVSQARQALSLGDKSNALIYMKLAVGMEPANAMARAELGIALLEGGEYAAAENQLRIARTLGAKEDLTLVPLFEAMLTLGESQTFLDLYQDPGNERTPLAALILRARAVALQTLGKDAEATSAVARALLIKRDLSGLLTAGRIALMQGHVESGNGFIDEALRQSPDDIDVNALKVSADLQSSDPAQALAVANRFVAKNPMNLAARLIRINAYLTLGQNDQAKSDLNFILSRVPDLTIALYYRGIVLAREHKVSAAWNTVHGLPSVFLESQPEIATNVADMAVSAGFLDTGLKILDAAVEKNPGRLDLRLKVAELRLRQKSPEYALNVLAPVEDSKDPRVSIMFAEAYLQMRRGDRASEYIRRAIDLGGGEELLSLGAESALTNVRSRLQRNPKNGGLRRLYATLLLRVGDLANARAQYELLVQSGTPDALSLNNLAWLVQKDDPHRALDLARHAVNLDPKSPYFEDTLGWIELNQSDAKDALGALQRAHALKPDDAQISYHLAVALHANGEATTAKAVLKAAVAAGGFAEKNQAETLLASWR